MLLNSLPGNEPAEWDVDITGNDTPTSSYPHVEIDSQRRSSSSSSSDSGSSTGSCYDDAFVQFIYLFFSIDWNFIFLIVLMLNILFYLC